MMKLRGGTLSVLASLLLLSACAGKHTPSAQAVFRIEGSGAALTLVPPAQPGGIATSPILFSQIIIKQYGFNPWEEYVDLSPGMRLSVQRMTSQPQTTNTYYAVMGAGRRGFHVRSMTPETESFDQRTRFLRFFYQIKFTHAPGQPQRPALFVWSDSPEQLAARTVQAKENADFPCGSATRDCLSFPGKTTVSPEVEITVNQKPRYVLLSSTVRDLLRADRVRDDAEIHVLRKYRNHMIPVTWQQKASVLPLPLVAGDDVSW
jgi:hypothetical protein